MTDVDFFGLLVVASVAFAAPLLVSLVPRIRIPASVAELVGGIMVGGSGLGLVEVDQPVRVLSLIGLVFLLFLAGLELDFDRLRGRRLGVAVGSFVVSFALALGVAFTLHGAGQVDAPLLVAVILVATALGVVAPALKDAGRVGSDLGQVVIAAASIADLGAIILLSLSFSRDASSALSRVLLLGGFVTVAVGFLVGLLLAERWTWFEDLLGSLEGTTAQIRVRGSLLLLIGFVVVADRFGLEIILGAFLAGALLRLVDSDGMSHDPHLSERLETVGYGVFIPVFFVASGAQLDLASLFESPSALVRVPLFVIALLVVRGLPALLYRTEFGVRETAAAGLLQATSLPFIVAATMIGVELRLLDPATAATLIAAGLISVLLFPAFALTLLGQHDGLQPASRAPADGGTAPRPSTDPTG